MEKIYNYNCDGLCCEKTCDKRYTHFQKVEMYGMTLLLGFCDEHSDKISDEILKQLKKRKTGNE